MSRRLIQAATVATLVLALGFGLRWWSGVQDAAGRAEAAAGVLAVLAAVLGIPAQRWAAARERRMASVAALRREIEDNRAVLAGVLAEDAGRARRRVYPRLMTAAAELAATAALDPRRDAELVTRILRWIDGARAVNRRFDVTELRMFAVERLSDVELQRLYAGPHRSGLLQQALEQLADLDGRLVRVQRQDGGWGAALTTRRRRR
ncbi:MAG TPA: hypothetical protein VFY17_06300 [Pilimelia sp.]|nr:hypothetical protein [Pilimelia sp.]